MKRRTLYAALFSATLLAASPAIAQDAVAVEVPAATATDFVQERADQILSIVNASASDAVALEAKREELRAAIRDFLSFEVLAERTLGDEWETRTPEQRTEFVTLLRDLIETSYLRDLGTSTVDADQYAVTYSGERSRRGRTTVEGTIAVSGDTHFIEVKMMMGHMGWVVYDLVTDDVSLEESYAESFASIIADDGWDALLERMRERLAEMRSE